MAYRKPALKPASDAEKAKILEELIKEGKISAEAVNGRINSMREETRERLKSASMIAEEQRTLEQTELLKNLEAQYPIMEATLKRYEISTEGMPSWKQVQQGLTAEVLGKALKLAEPTLLLIPPTTRESKIEALDNHKVEGQYDASTYNFKNNDLWNGGEVEANKKWKVSIVEGIQNVEQDSRIYDGKKENYEMVKKWIAKLEAQGLDSINDADTYLILMMKSIFEGKPVDSYTWTVLNGKGMTKRSSVACGIWRKGVSFLVNVRPVYSNSDLRLRGSVGVDVLED